MIKKRLILAFWCLLAIAIAGLFIAAMQQRKASLCTDIKVEIDDNGHPFVSETDIVNMLKANGIYEGEKISDINLRTFENLINKQPWIQQAELFFDNNAVLNVTIKERAPIARVFTTDGASFYIDSSGMRLPLSPDYSAHVPMFTSFNSNKKKLSKRDSLLLNDVKNIALYIQQDSFWNAQVSQLVITPQGTFNIIPVVGNQTIILGNADSLASKFGRLLAWYQQVWKNTGFEKYETVNVSFTGLVVATRRNEPKPYVDSVLAQRIVWAMRSGVDILADSSYLFHNADASQKISTDTLHSTTLSNVLITMASDSATHKKEVQPTIKIYPKNKGNRTLKQPKATMPKTRSGKPRL